MRLIILTLFLAAYASSVKSIDFGWLLDKLTESTTLPAETTNDTPAGSPTTCPCGMTNKKSRIVGGSTTSPNEYPFMLSMIFRATREHFCGAAILTETYAITAAHCTHSLGYKQISVVAGSHRHNSISSTTQTVPVAKYIEHEQYSQTLLVKNDIAILILGTPLKFNSFVSPICMPVSKLNLENQVVKIIGWGKTGQYHPVSPVLQEIDVRVNTDKECKSAFSFAYISDGTMLCTSSPGKVACMGDSGGPAFYMDPDTNRYTLVGLVSFGFADCQGNKPSIETAVSAFIPWVQSKVKGNLCHKK